MEGLGGGGGPIRWTTVLGVSQEARAEPKQLGSRDSE